MDAGLSRWLLALGNSNVTQRANVPPLRVMQRAPPNQTSSAVQTSPDRFARCGRSRHASPEEKVSGVLMDRGCHVCCLPHSLRSGQRQIWCVRPLTPRRTPLANSNLHEPRTSQGQDQPHSSWECGRPNTTTQTKHKVRLRTGVDVPDRSAPKFERFPVSELVCTRAVPDAHASG